MDIYLGGFGIYMAEQRLDVFDVNATFKQMARKAVAAAMTGNMSSNASLGCAFFEVLVDAVRIKIGAGPRTGEKNVPGPAALEPVLCQKIKVSVGKDRIPVMPALAFTDMNGLFGAGYVIIMKMSDFRHS